MHCVGIYSALLSITALASIPVNGFFNYFPDSLDWRTKRNIVTPVKNQGSCVSAWASATVDVLESRVRIATGERVSLSVQNLIDCGHVFCGGGIENTLIEMALENIAKWKGLKSESDYPFRGRKQRCRFQYSTENRFPANIDEEKPFQIITDSESDVIEALQQGPVIASFHLDEQANKYGRGIFKGTTCSSAIWDANHVVAIVGYGVDRKTNEPYWILKNSRGTAWGEGGYMRMQRGSNMCGILNHVIVPSFKST